MYVQYYIIIRYFIKYMLCLFFALYLLNPNVTWQLIGIFCV